MDNLENQAKAEAQFKRISSSVSEESCKEYEKFLELNLMHIPALWNLGCIYDGDYDHSGNGSYWDEFYCADQGKAIDCFTKILNTAKPIKDWYYLEYLNLNPQDYSMIVNIGWIYYRMNKKQEAMVNFTKCIQQNQEDQRALKGLASIYKDQGNFKDALKCFKKYIEIHPKIYEAHANVGRIYNKIVNIKEAIDSYRKCNHLNYIHKQANAYLHQHVTKH